jgi:hypothetical protein
LVLLAETDGDLVERYRKKGKDNEQRTK